jgi:hypothetical protein
LPERELLTSENRGICPPVVMRDLFTEQA